MTDKRLTCAECDELFLEYFEGELDAACRTMIDAHAATCARCQGLIRDIQGITETAANLPDLEPSRDLWQGVADRIQPAVVAIGYRREGISLSRRVIGLAAAALVVVSSSVTYLATRGPEIVRVTNAPPPVPVDGANIEVGAPAPSVEPSQNAPEISPAAGSGAPAVRAPDRQRRPDVGGSAPAASPRTALASVRPAPTSAADAALAPEIALLQNMLKQRRDQLDPSTIKVVEDNLALIDAAVQQARAALMRDPASGFLTERLDNALQKKVELLRTVALLPSRS